MNEGTLGWHARRVAVPTYDRWALTPSVVHFGVGAFHRSHQAVYLDDIAERGISREWGLVGVGLHRRAMGDALSEQDGLYTVVSRDGGEMSARVVGVMGHYLFAPDNPAAVVATLAHPRTRLVTLTVTATAYRERVDLDRPGFPTSAIGFLVEALDRRRLSGVEPFTVLSCDNLPGNGAVTERAVVGLARRRDPGLADWLETHGAFPSSMVDRITPQTSAADRDLVTREFGLRDRWPVMTEPFSQWIVEDDFCAGRPPLDAVGARFVPDVRPYSLMKTRMLNGAHCAIGYAGSLAGYSRIDDAVADPVLAAFLEQMMGAEVAPLLDPVPGIDLDDYRDTLMERFANRGIGDPLERLCRNGSSKVPSHLLASIGEARERGLSHPRLTLAVAAWLRYLRGTDERGRELVLDDPMGDRLQKLARAAGGDLRRLLAEPLFGELGADPEFADELEDCLRSIDRLGVREATRRLITDVEPVAA